MLNEIKIPLFRISASQCGKIMTEPQGKSIKEGIAELEEDLSARRMKYNEMKPGLKKTEKALEMILRKSQELEDLYLKKDEPNLSKTCTTYLKKWLDEKIYQREVRFTSKQTDKGNLVEASSINYASIHLGWGLVSKNLDRFYNDYAHGEPDLVLDDEIPDIKSSWTHETFPLYENELPEKDYEWQDLVYQWLTGKRKGSIVFVLTSMPEDMIRKEARWKLPEGYTEQEYEDFAAQFRYDDLPPYLRLKQFEVEYSEEKIKQIEARVLECRKYIETVLLPQVEKNFEKFKK